MRLKSCIWRHNQHYSCSRCSKAQAPTNLINYLMRITWPTFWITVKSVASLESDIWHPEMWLNNIRLKSPHVHSWLQLTAKISKRIKIPIKWIIPDDYIHDSINLQIIWLFLFFNDTVIKPWIMNRIECTKENLKKIKENLKKNKGKFKKNKGK